MDLWTCLKALEYKKVWMEESSLGLVHGNQFRTSKIWTNDGRGMNWGLDFGKNRSMKYVSRLKKLQDESTQVSLAAPSSRRAMSFAFGETPTGNTHAISFSPWSKLAKNSFYKVLKSLSTTPSLRVGFLKVSMTAERFIAWVTWDNAPFLQNGSSWESSRHSFSNLWIKKVSACMWAGTYPLKQFIYVWT